MLLPPLPKGLPSPVLAPVLLALPLAVLLPVVPSPRSGVLGPTVLLKT